MNDDRTHPSVMEEMETCIDENHDNRMYSSIIKEMEACIDTDIEEIKDESVKEKLRISDAIDRCSEETLRKRYTI